MKVLGNSLVELIQGGPLEVYEYMKDICDNDPDMDTTDLESQFGGKIYVCIGAIRFAYDKTTKIIYDNGKATKGNDLGSLWRDLSEKTAEKKYTKFNFLYRTMQDYQNQ